MCLQENKIKNDGEHDQNVSFSASSTTNGSLSDGKQKVHLPKLSSKLFKEDSIKFQAFWDSFEAAVHKNEDVSDVGKMSYVVSPTI